MVLPEGQGETFKAAGRGQTWCTGRGLPGVNPNRGPCAVGEHVRAVLPPAVLSREAPQELWVHSRGGRLPLSPCPGALSWDFFLPGADGSFSPR